MTPNPTNPDWPSIEAELGYSLYRLKEIKKLADQGNKRSPIIQLVDQATGAAAPDWLELTQEADDLMARIDFLKEQLET